MFLSSVGCSSLIPSGGDNQLLPSADEGRGRKEQRRYGGLQCGKKKVFNSSRVSCFKRRGKGKVLQLPWTVLRGRLKANECSFVIPRISLLPSKHRSLPSRRNWRRLKRLGNKQKGTGIRLSKRDMT